MIKNHVLIDSCNKTRTNSKTEYRINTSVLNTIIHCYYIQKNFRSFSLDVTCLLRKGFPLIFIQIPTARIREVLPEHKQFL